MDAVAYLIWPLVCDLLWDALPDSLYSLSLVSRVCHNAAAPYTCRQLRLVVSSHATLRRRVKQLLDHRHQHSFFTYARQLYVCGKMLPVGASENDEDRFLARRRAAAETARMKSVDICGATELEPSYDSAPILDDAQPTGTDVDYNHLWRSLATLAATFQHLSEFHYACTNPLPSCLLDVLHLHQPSCHIHLHSFRFQSLRDAGIHPFDLHLLQSPNVKTVTVRHSVCDKNGREDHTVEAIREAIQGARNIDNLRIQACRVLSRSARAHLSQQRSQHRPKNHIPLLGQIPRTATPRTICAQSEIDFNWDAWTEAVDMSQLQTLNLGRVRKLGTLRRLSRSANLASLERLALKFELSWTEDAQMEAETFFETLRPLTTLRLHGMVNLTLLNTIIGRHGLTLRELLIDSYSLNSEQPRPLSLTAVIIGQLSSKCPRLKELELTIPRSKSDRKEAACYHALGNFNFLEKLSLHLDCSVSQTDLSSREERSAVDFLAYTSSPSEQIYNPDIGDLLINAAVDENLARSIWESITSSPRPSSLQWLRISPRKAGYLGSFIPHGVQDGIEHMSRTFQLVKNGEPAIDIVEIGQVARERRDRKWRQIETEYLKRFDRPIDGDFQGVMRTIWPFEEGDDWRSCWSSFPLPQL